MRLNEIIRNRIPPAYQNRIPHSELIDQQDPTFNDLNGYSSHMINANSSESASSNGMNHVESEQIEMDPNIGQSKIATSELFLGRYARHIAADQSMIAADIRKYLSSNYVNPHGNSSYFDSRRRIARFSHSF